MSTSPDSSATEVHDFAQVIATTVQGRKPLIIGGHAVNIWALAYRKRLSPSIDAFYPFTSKDLDLYGTAELLEKLHQKFGGEKRLSEPRSPIIGSIHVYLHGHKRKIEVLHTVRGLQEWDMTDVIPLEVGSLSALVLSPQKLLKAKICNAATLDQNGRNDTKHLHMMTLCLHEFIKDYADQVGSSENSGRLLVNLLEEVFTTTQSPDAKKAASLWNLTYDAVWPLEYLRRLGNPKVDNFIQHRLKSLDSGAT